MMGVLFLYYNKLMPCVLFMQEGVHAAGPSTVWDYVVTWLSIGIVLFTLILSVLYLLNPEKYDRGSIKHIVVDP